MYERGNGIGEIRGAQPSNGRPDDRRAYLIVHDQQEQGQQQESEGYLPRKIPEDKHRQCQVKRDPDVNAAEHFHQIVGVSAMKAVNPQGNPGICLNQGLQYSE